MRPNTKTRVRKDTIYKCTVWTHDKVDAKTLISCSVQKKAEQYANEIVEIEIERKKKAWFCRQW